MSEVKSKSIFAGRSGIYEDHRKMLIQPEIVITRGMFEKERNITQALIKRGGIETKPDPNSGNNQMEQEN